MFDFICINYYLQEEKWTVLHAVHFLHALNFGRIFRTFGSTESSSIIANRTLPDLYSSVLDLKMKVSFSFQYNAKSDGHRGNPSHFLMAVLSFLSMTFTVEVQMSSGHRSIGISMNCKHYILNFTISLFLSIARRRLLIMYVLSCIPVCQ